jgi:hypothetical protein
MKEIASKINVKVESKIVQEAISQGQVTKINYETQAPPPPGMYFAYFCNLSH